jgi:steroid 5-alpha reductase family enzyme
MVKKVKKKTRNKFRDRLADYYLTNREITKEADARYKKVRQEGGKRPWTTSEKTMLAITLIALTLVVVRQLFF